MSNFGLYENLEFGNDSVQVRKQARNNSILTAAHLAIREFGPYLNGASDKDEFNDRLGYIISDVNDLIERTASFEDTPEVLKALAWNFDKKKDSDDDDSDKDGDDDSKDSDDDGDDDSKDSKDDSDKSDDDKDVPDYVDTDDDDDDSRKESSRRKADSDSDDDSDEPDYVDTDEDDDHDRDDDSDSDSKDDDDKKKKESRKKRSDDQSQGFSKDLTELTLPSNPVDEDFEGEVNDLEPAGFNAVGKTGYRIVPRLAAPQHLNPANPGGPQWQNTGPSPFDNPTDAADRLNTYQNHKYTKWWIWASL